MGSGKRSSSVSAQRLSASQRSARGALPRQGTRSEGAQRLSASQRSARREIEGCRGRTECAQRLSASQRSALDHRIWACPGCVRAQRLSASQRSAHDALNLPRRVHVSAQRLSASQRSAHFRTADDGARSVPVLNAFRHHRGRHSSLRRRDWSLRECSTPFGITEVGTQNARQFQARLQVLNAFRHHRGRHMIFPSFGCIGYRCSTPFGITEVGTRAGARGYFGSACAQRLSASQRSAHRQHRLARPVMFVLNAFRHHRGRHRDRGGARGGGSAVLNAFRHHRGRHRRSLRDSRR